MPPRSRTALGVISALFAACSGRAPVDDQARLRAQACPDGGCVSVSCPSVSEAECTGLGAAWLRDDATGACCHSPCTPFSSPGFQWFRTEVACQAQPECNGYPIGTALPAGDDCNTCTCTTAKRWECTQRRCSGQLDGKGCGYFLGGCPASQYCAFVPQDSCSDGDAPSVCLERPASCTTEAAPVCACNGRTYSNSCEAARAGSGIRGLGPCRPFKACEATDECPADEYCSSAHQCEKRPIGCVNQFSPVCGKDGRPYGNACLAAMAGTQVRKQGACVAGCSGADDCAPDEYCSACSAGQCLPRERSGGACTASDTVCGCDGTTYGCEAVAHLSGVSVAHAGPCP